MRRRRSRPSRIVEAAVAGFLAGTITVAVAFWAFAHVPHQPSPHGGYAADRSLAPDRKRSRPDPAADPTPVIEPIPASAATPSIGADPIPELRGRKLGLPVQDEVREALRDSFDEKRGSTHNHEAIDIMAPRNTPVLAVDDGTIARLFESRAGGTTVYQFDVTTTYVYYYAHLERYADGLREGNHVRRGQVLGYVGTSGNAPKDTPHLHFAIFRLTEKKQWWRGSPIDPYAVLK
jgi:murein DD-endopeptidase MepM/ murein hydrolase activator NlpD